MPDLPLWCNARGCDRFRSGFRWNKGRRAPVSAAEVSQTSIVEQEVEGLKAVSARAVRKIEGLARRFGLRVAQQRELTIRRVKRGRGFALAVMESLARVTPAASQLARNRQIKDAVKASAEEFANTPSR